MAGVVVLVLVDLVPDLAWLCVSRERGGGRPLTWFGIAEWVAVVVVVDDGGGRRTRGWDGGGGGGRKGTTEMGCG